MKKKITSWFLIAFLNLAGFAGLAHHVASGGERAALQEREEFFVHLSEALALAGVCYWQWDYKSDSVGWSAELYDLYGVPRDYVSTYDVWLAAIHPEDRARADAICSAAVQANEPYLMRYRVVTPSGEIRHILETASPDRDRKLMVGICLLEKSEPARDDG